MIKFLKKITQPNSQQEDRKRSEFITNILLLGFIFFSFFAFLATSFSIVVLKEKYSGFSLWIVTFILAFAIFLFRLSRGGHPRIVSYILIFLYLIPAVASTLIWGVELPQGLLNYALIIVISGILIGTNFAWITTTFICLFLLILAHFQTINAFQPNLAWKDTLLRFPDACIFVFTLIIITLVSWLSNREIGYSLRRAQNSEKELKKERDLLEIRVEERTKELKEVELQKMAEMARFAEFGQLTTGIFHDLTNPLTAISLNLEAAKNKREELSVKPYVEQALKATKRVEIFISSVRKQIQNQETKQNFSLNHEINQVLSVLSYKARKAKAEIIFEDKQTVKLEGNPLRFYQIVSNLVSNAIDAYHDSKKSDKKILITLREEAGSIVFGVEDFGKGISEKDLPKIFDPFFTTKNLDVSIGIGLVTTKKIVEQDFSGYIDVESTEGKGTKFIVTIPKND